MGGISRQAAQRLRAAGLTWRPRAGDRFTLLPEGRTDEVFTVSDMVIEQQDCPTGTILGFSGTTEWALDSVRVDDTLWLPREDQMRELLGHTFRSLARSTTGWYQVLVEVPGRPEEAFGAENPEDAYAEALLSLVRAATC